MYAVTFEGKDFTPGGRAEPSPEVGLLSCGHQATPKGIAAGYAVTTTGKVCYDCAAAAEKAFMVETGRMTLYLVKGPDGWEVTNWTGHLKYRVAHQRGSRTNWDLK